MTYKHRVSKSFKLLSACFAFFIWGLWAYHANELTTVSVRVVIALAQGASSFLMTLVMVSMVSFFFTRFEANRFAFILPSLITVSLSASVLVLIHTILGTPNILLTITPALSMAFLFCLITTYQLRRQLYAA